MMSNKNIALALIVIGLFLLITRSTETFETVQMSSQGSTCWWNPTTSNNGCDSGLHCIDNNNNTVKIMSPFGTCQSCSKVENNICTRT